MWLHRSALAAGLAFLSASSTHLAYATTEAPSSSVADRTDSLDKKTIELRTQIIQLRNGIKEKPADPRLNIALARLLLEDGQFGEAEARARVAQANGGDDGEVAPVLAQAMLEEGKFTILVQVVLTGSRPPKSEAQVRAVLARAHLALGEVGFVEPLIADAKRLDPNGLPVAIATTQLLLSRSDVAGADAELAKARQLAPDDLDVLRLVAQIDVLKGDPAGALAACDSILAKWPADISALVTRASLRLDAGQAAAARSDVDKLLDVAPYLLVARYLDAVLLAESGDLLTADERLMRVSTDFRSLPDGYYLQAIVEVKLGRLERAMDAIYNFVALEPNDPRGGRLMAILALRQDDPQKAIDALRALVQRQPNDGLAATIMARAYSLQGKEDRAFEYYDRAGSAVTNSIAPGGKAAATLLDSGVTITLGSLDEFARSVLDENTLVLVSLISDVKLGAISRASTAAEALAGHKPVDAVAQDWLGIIRVRQQRYDEAITLFDSLIKAHPKFLDARRNRAHAYEAAGNSEAAEKTWEDVLDQAPGDEQAYLGLAELALKAGDIAKGAQWLQTAQRNAQDTPAPGLTALNLYVSIKDWDHALPLAQGLSSFFKFDPKVANATAQVLATTGHLDQAKVLYEHFLRVSPDSAEAYAGKAQLLSDYGEKAAARDAFVKATAAAPGEFGYENALVDFDDANKGQNEALKTARSFAAVDPVGSALLSAGVLVKYNHAKDAIASLKSAYAEHPDSKIVILLAQLMAGNGDTSAAEATARSWLNDHPQDWQVELQLANLYASRHADDDAFATYLRVVTAAPRNATVLNNLAWAAVKKADPRALDWAERAYYLAPSAQTSDTYGWILTRSGHPATGLPLLKSALAGEPNDPSVAYHLAATLEAAGQKDSAKTLLQSVLKSGDQFEERQQAERLLASLQPG